MRYKNTLKCDIKEQAKYSQLTINSSHLFVFFNKIYTSINAKFLQEKVKTFIVNQIQSAFSVKASQNAFFEIFKLSLECQIIQFQECVSKCNLTKHIENNKKSFYQSEIRKIAKMHKTNNSEGWHTKEPPAVSKH